MIGRSILGELLRRLRGRLNLGALAPDGSLLTCPPGSRGPVVLRGKEALAEMQRADAEGDIRIPEDWLAANKAQGGES